MLQFQLRIIRVRRVTGQDVDVLVGHAGVSCSHAVIVTTTSRTARVWDVALTSWTPPRRRADDRRLQTEFVNGQGHVQGHEGRGSRVCDAVRCDPPRWPSGVRPPGSHCRAVVDEAAVAHKGASRRRTLGGPRCSASASRVTAARRGRPVSRRYVLDWRRRLRGRVSHRRRIRSVAAKHRLQFKT